MAPRGVAGALLVGVVILSINSRCRGSVVPGSEGECLTYLCKYGYFSDLDCYCAVAPMSVRMRELIGRHPATRQKNPCGAAQLNRALVAYQKAYELTVTAACDEQTLKAMQTPRCGVADDVMSRDSQPKAPISVVTNLAILSLGTSQATSGASAVGALKSGGIPRRVRMTASSPLVTGAHMPRLLVEAPGRLSVSRAQASTAMPGTAKSVRKSRRRRAMLAAVFEAAARLSTGGEQFETADERLQRYWQDVRKSYDDLSKVVAAQAEVGNQRRRRGTVINNSSFTFTKTSLKWRIISYSGNLPQVDQNTAMDAAFRLWAAVTPLCFANDQVSDASSLDILLGFYSGSHAGDSRPFDGPGGELAHSHPGTFSHFDATESWYTGTSTQTGVALSAVALHEFGHIIGLPHSTVANSVMYSPYLSFSPGVLLSDADRAAARAKYGPCSGPFDAVLDVQYVLTTIDVLGNPVAIRYYSTFFFRGAMNWLYINALQRPADYEPQAIGSYWTGVPNAVDAAFQYTWRGAVQVFFLKGSTVYLFNYSPSPIGVTASYSISTFFPAGPLGEPVPNNVDSAYFDPRDGYIYFFKGRLVYVYLYNATGPHSCCVSKSNISDVFPAAAGQPATVGGMSYQQNVDVVYHSLSNNSLFIFVGNRLWKNQNFDSSSTTVSNSMTYVGTWNSNWNYICDIVC